MPGRGTSSTASSSSRISASTDSEEKGWGASANLVGIADDERAVRALRDDEVHAVRERFGGLGLEPCPKAGGGPLRGEALVAHEAQVRHQHRLEAEGRRLRDRSQHLQPARAQARAPREFRRERPDAVAGGEHHGTRRDRALGMPEQRFFERP